MTNVIVPSQNPPEGPVPPAPVPATAPVPAPTPIQAIIPGAPIIPTAQPPIVAPSQPPILGPAIVPTPVSQVESSLFNAHGFKPPAQQSTVPPAAQNTRQINDVIQSGKFNFLQDSELEISEMNSGVVPSNPPVQVPQVPNAPASALPTRTFTNQNFNGQPNSAFPQTNPPPPAYFQNFVPTFPAFVAPTTSPTPTSGTNSTNTNNGNNVNNNLIPPIPMPPTRNPNAGFNQRYVKENV